MARRFSGFALAAALVATFFGTASASAQEMRPSLEDSFRLGSGTGLLCQVQSRLTDPAMATMFDRAFAIVCRDAATAVGNVYVLRSAEGNPAERLASLRADQVTCGNSETVVLEDVGRTNVTHCTLTDSPVRYAIYQWQDDETTYVAEGLSGYDSALRLALRTIVADRIVAGELSIATTLMGDAAAFARVQAGTLDTDQALAEGYRRNNSGNYAEAAEFFATLLSRNTDRSDGAALERAGEFLINQALQQSNLGDFGAADATYARALAIPSASATQLRLRRNFRTLHLLNQRQYSKALAVLDEELLAHSLSAEISGATISPDISARLNSGTEFDRTLGGQESDRLTTDERVIILDAQALQLRGSILRVLGETDTAQSVLNRSLEAIASVRDGRVRSTARLRSQALIELAAINEAERDFGSAESRLRDAVRLLAIQYPRSVTANAAKARLAAFLARRGDTDQALSLFAEVVEDIRDRAIPRTSLENQLAPYFELLLARMANDPSLVSQFFLASETLIRPGVANTQTVLARELSQGNDDAARLFRQSVTLARAIESARVELSRLTALASQDASSRARAQDLQSQLTELREGQTATQAQLSQYPRYQALSTEALTLADLQATLQPGEAYLKLSQVAGRLYGILATPSTAIAYRAGIDAETLESRVDALRATISTIENGVQLTYPYDIRLAHQLFVDLLGPIANDMASIDHLIFEPDGGMMRLPASLLVTEEAGVASYERRLGSVGNDDFDFSGVAWLGRERDISTALSARGFRDVRRLPASSATRRYLGFGENSEPHTSIVRTSNQYASIDPRCHWPLDFWRAPISASELVTVRRLLGSDGSDVVTGDDFNDSAVVGRDDLDQYRILHFATHGLVTQSREECPPRPALLTSFGDMEGSDGLLSFGEIFDLNLNADLVILSACDTASAAGTSASLEAGVTGGNSALDGLVRAFVGAGSRVVLATHWPAPDDFSATERLVVSLFEESAGTPVAVALRRAQRSLMSDPVTSHPYYWAGFTIIGDGAHPVVRED